MHPSVYYHPLSFVHTCEPQNTFQFKEETNCRHPNLWCNDFIYKDFGLKASDRAQKRMTECHYVTGELERLFKVHVRRKKFISCISAVSTPLT